MNKEGLSIVQKLHVRWDSLGASTYDFTPARLDIFRWETFKDSSLSVRLKPPNLSPSKKHNLGKNYGFISVCLSETTKSVT